MPIYDALQLAYTLAQSKARGQHVRHGSDQILGGHLLAILGREQRALGLGSEALTFQNRAEYRPGLVADPLQVGLGESSIFLG